MNKIFSTVKLKVLHIASNQSIYLVVSIHSIKGRPPLLRFFFYFPKLVPNCLIIRWTNIELLIYTSSLQSLQLRIISHGVGRFTQCSFVEWRAVFYLNISEEMEQRGLCLRSPPPIPTSHTHNHVTCLHLYVDNN